MTDEESLACRLKLLRKAKKLTQDELADKLKLTKSAISKFETGNSSPSFDTLKKVASLYNVSVDYLLNGQKGLDILFVDPFGAEAQRPSLQAAQ
jgi:transcriptional regulator with XRE-family HTH domain